MAGTWRSSRERVEAPLLQRRTPTTAAAWSSRPGFRSRVMNWPILAGRRFRLLALDADQRRLVLLIGKPDLEGAVGDQRQATTTATKSATYLTKSRLRTVDVPAPEAAPPLEAAAPAAGPVRLSTSAFMRRYYISRQVYSRTPWTRARTP